jgi:alpha-tubulin suppressor-like RCC1 family protein
MYGGSPAVMVTCGGRHTLVLTSVGFVDTERWETRDKETRDKETKRQETRNKETRDKGQVWSCGLGYYGQLGNGDTANKLVLTLVGAEGFRGAQIVMVVAGGAHSVALGAAGRVWTWGHGNDGKLGNNDEVNRLVPTLLAGEALGGAAAVLVAAGRHHTVAVTLEGKL